MEKFKQARFIVYFPTQSHQAIAKRQYSELHAAVEEKRYCKLHICRLCTKAIFKYDVVYVKYRGYVRSYTRYFHIECMLKRKLITKQRALYELRKSIHMLLNPRYQLHDTRMEKVRILVECYDRVWSSRY